MVRMPKCFPMSWWSFSASSVTSRILCAARFKRNPTRSRMKGGTLWAGRPVFPCFFNNLSLSIDPNLQKSPQQIITYTDYQLHCQYLFKKFSRLVTYEPGKLLFDGIKN